MTQALRKVSLKDKYEATEGVAYMSGLQALTRIPLVQRHRDIAAGLNTAGFISGYRGSPLGGYDRELIRIQKYLDEVNVKFVPGVNEDLAATAVWGTQQVGLLPGQRSMAFSACGTARHPVLTAAAMSCATPTPQALRQRAVCWRSSATITVANLRHCRASLTTRFMRCRFHSFTRPAFRNLLNMACWGLPCRVTPVAGVP